MKNNILLKIPFRNNESLDCYIDALVSMILYYGYEDYSYLIISLWDFKYDNSIDKIISDRIYPVNREYNEILNEIYGITIDKIFRSNFEEYIEIVYRELIERRPVIAIVDTYSCPFARYYQIHRGAHTAIINGFDLDKGLYYLSDPHYNILNYELTKEQLYNCLLSVKVLNCNGNKKLPDKCEFLIFQLKSILYKRDLFSSIEKVGQEVLTDNTVRNIFTDTENNNVKKLRTNIQTIAKARESLASIINMGMLMVRDRSIIDDLMKVTAKWKITAGLINKFALTGGKEGAILEEISEFLMKIADQEKAAAEKLLKDTLRKDYINNSYKKLKEVYKHELVDISSYFNNRGFDLADSDILPSLTDDNCYFMLEGVPDNKIWSSGMYKFDMSAVLSAGFDNISCKGQNINVEILGKNFITLLCLAETTMVSIDIELYFSDESTQVVRLDISDWADRITLQNNYIFWEGWVARKVNDRIIENFFDAKIYAVKIPVKEGAIKKIKLPICNNFHIFAITALYTD